MRCHYPYAELKLIVISTVFILCILVLAAVSFPAVLGINQLTVFSPNSRPYGVTYGDWTAKWWQWFISMPNDKDHPFNDPTGANCGRNQAGPVWFLPGYVAGYTERTCTISGGKAILFATINNECSTAEDPSLKTESDLKKCAVSNASYFRNFEVTVDGVPIKDLEKYNVVSPLFNVTFPEHPIFTAHVGPTQAVSAGDFVLLGPLSRGTHDIHFKGASVDFTGAAAHNFAQDVRYKVIVP
jgi:hypothetical protein